MATPSDYLDSADLKNVAAGGIVREDVLDTIFDCSDIPTPFMDMIGGGSFDNPYSEWTEDELAQPDLGNKVISGKDTTSADNDANVTNAVRAGNHAQISDKNIQVTERGNAANSIGLAGQMGYQTARRLIELRRDIEAIMLSDQASVQDNNNNVAGQSAGAGAYIKTNVSLGASGAVGGFDTATKLIDAPTPGEARVGSWTYVTDMIEAVYLLGAMPTKLMSVPAVTKRMSRYLFTTPYAATPTANVTGTAPASQTSQGYIDVVRTDFGFTMDIVPNRLQQVSDSGDDPVEDVATLYGFDLRYWDFCTLYGWKVDALGKVGLSHRKLAHVDWMLKCKLERAQFAVRDLTPTGTWTA